VPHSFCDVIDRDYDCCQRVPGTPYFSGLDWNVVVDTLRFDTIPDTKCKLTNNECEVLPR